VVRAAGDVELDAATAGELSAGDRCRVTVVALTEPLAPPPVGAVGVTEAVSLLHPLTVIATPLSIANTDPNVNSRRSIVSFFAMSVPLVA
jgi:hypothetical protein